MICSKFYVTSSRLDIMQAIGLVARFQSAPNETHFQVVEEFTLPIYIDANWVGSIGERNNTSGEELFLGKCIREILR